MEEFFLEEYQPLTAEIRVPKEWPVGIARNLITEFVQMATRHHMYGKKVVVKIGKISAVITNNRSGPGYILKSTGNAIDEETYVYHLILPVKMEMMNSKPGGNGNNEPEALNLLPLSVQYNHPISDLYMTRSKRYKVVVAKPNLKKICHLKGITGADVYNQIACTTFRVHMIKWLRDAIDDPEMAPPSPQPGTSMSVQPIDDNTLDIVCFESLPRPRRFGSNLRPTTYTCIRVSFIFFLITCAVYLWVLMYQKL